MDYIEMVDDATHYIENNLDKDITLDQLAERYYISKYYFFRIFKTVTNKTLKVYMDERKLIAAAKEIKETDKKVKDIAAKYAYGSPETFTRRFKRFFGVTPTEYRNEAIEIMLQSIIPDHRV